MAKTFTGSYDGPDDVNTQLDLEVVESRVVDTQRWAYLYREVVTDGSEYARYDYLVGATEYQDDGYSLSDQSVKAIPVKPVEVTVTRYEKV
jgi:hypothetical protein